MLLFAAFLGMFFWFLNDGLLGHDYYYFFPKLLDGKWHFLRQGFSPFYYSVHECGGFPEYANPQALFYSLPQFLVLSGIDIWHSVQLTILVSMGIGYIGWYRFGNDIVRLNTAWSHVLALIVSAHGFHFMHMIPGHVPFHSMPLIGWLLWLLLNTTQTPKKRSAWFALATAYILYSGGYMVFVMLLFALLAIVPFDLLLSPKPMKRAVYLLAHGSVCGAYALMIAASKLVATFSFLRYFPRELPFERLYDDTSIFVYVFRALFGFPQTNALFTEFGMPQTGAVHEYSLMVSPIVLVGLLCGVYMLWKHYSIIANHPVRSVLLAGVFTLELVFFAQLARGFGTLVTPLETLPIFSGLHVNMRYLYAYSFLLISVSLWVLARLFPQTVSTYIAGTLTVAAFFFGYKGLLNTDSLPRIMDYSATKTALESFPNYLDAPVTDAIKIGDTIPGTFLPFVEGSTVIDCMEPMLLGSSSLPDTVQVGSVSEADGETFNLYNPACMIYPMQNNCAPGDRIALDDNENFAAFTAGEKTTWKQSLWQNVANWLSLLTLVEVLIAVTLGKVMGSSLHR